MLKYPCLVLDHDDTVVQSETGINYPFFCYILDKFRPGTKITLDEYVYGCCELGFAGMCREKYAFTEAEMLEEYLGWKDYVRSHVPEPFAGIGEIIRRQKAEGGVLCVVSHSSAENITRDYQTHFGILPDAIYGWDLPEHRRKPDAFPLEDIMARYAFSPKQLLVVDDMKPAYDMASKVGVPIAFAAWGRKAFPELTRQMQRICDFSFDSTQQLYDFLFD